MKILKVTLLLAAMIVGAIGAGSLSQNVSGKAAKWKTTCTYECVAGICELSGKKCETGGTEPACEYCSPNG